MRLFVAAPLSDRLKQAIREYHQVFTQEALRFIPDTNLHLTLHFIGEYPEERLPELREKLQAVAQNHPPFTLSFQETAPGPQLRSPRLVWTRFAGHPDFSALATALCEALDAAPGAHGKFIPHITIARLRKDRDKPLDLPIIREATVPNLEVKAFALWQSQLKSPHPEYRILENFVLGANRPE